MTFMRKLMDVLNMDNWEQKDNEPLPIEPPTLSSLPKESTPSSEPTLFTISSKDTYTSTEKTEQIEQEIKVEISTQSDNLLSSDAGQEVPPPVIVDNTNRINTLFEQINENTNTLSVILELPKFFNLCSKTELLIKKLTTFENSENILSFTQLKEYYTQTKQSSIRTLIDLQSKLIDAENNASIEKFYNTFLRYTSYMDEPTQRYLKKTYRSYRWHYVQNVKPKTSTAAKIDRNISVPSVPYKSKRFIIKGLHLYFTDIAREIIHDKKISYIPLMREYKLSEQELNTVIDQIAVAGIIDAEKKVLMTSQELEHFIDIYEPDLFKCEHAVFDKEIFMCIGEIIYSDGVEKVYDSLPADEVIDYLNILEKMNLIEYNSRFNQYKITSSYENFTEICKSIPASFSSSTYADADLAEQNTDFDNMTGVEFEKFTAHILSQNNFINIKITPASGDHGVDILAEKDNVTYAIQCKCYSSNIGNAAVQQAHTGKSLYHRDIAVVLTNQYFTQQAKDEAKELHVKLWDRDTLNNMLNKTS